ncbi:hypothetical protein QBC47DRAFT_380269 [Echria macrotheca]|uniref:Uncharacterized protein n=1 Tax=Echria macrotheca TaxID=438768 RepID=A0AAJ0BE68_9PEZI|nr:hypothetical protein QBC47DRAFT_380269 [Echria macrotheca]
MIRRLLVAVLAVAAVAQDCDYSSGKRCIKPQATATATIPFSPLFSSPPTFVYAIDELDQNDIAAQKKLNSLSIPDGYNGSVVKAGWWLQYDNNTVNKDRSQNRNYYAFALETNSTNAIGGDAGGCVNLLGSDCVNNLKSALAVATYNAAPIDGGMGAILGQLYAHPLLNLSCPADIFGTLGTAPNLDVPLTLNPFEQFAIMTDITINQDPLASGSPNFVHGVPQLRYRSLAEQGARGVVGVTISWPVTDPFAFGPPSYSMSDVTVETVCLRAGSVDALKKNGASGHRARGLGAVLAAGVAMYLL